MTNDEYREDPLDALLDSESDEEFGLPEIRDRYNHYADETVNGNLKHWTAEDFASIYTRFRPHLERHAKRYLSNPVQAEEVVQDAFLYLMTTLPELDTELGVLKFLKWKIRLLSLDVLRASSTRRETSVGENIEFESSDAPPSEEIERAEDSAVIRMALAKLNPRHREALVASIYEEKSSEQVAQQLGLNENATRQLIFRARSAFKKALVGETDTVGMSASEVLSVATKKAAADAKRNAGVIGSFVVLVAIGIGVIPQLVPADEQIVAESPAVTEVAPEGETAEPSIPATSSDPSTTGPSTTGSAASESEDEQSAVPADESSSQAEAVTDPSQTDQAQAESVAESTVPGTAESAAPESATPEPESSAASTQQVFSAASFTGILDTNVNDAGYYQGSRVAKFDEIFSGQSVEVFGGTGISAFMDIDPESQTAKNVIFQMWVDDVRLYGVARDTSSTTVETSNGYQITHLSENFYVADDQGRVFDSSPLADANATVSINLDENGAPTKASMVVED